MSTNIYIDDYEKQYRAMHPELAQKFHADDMNSATPAQSDETRQQALMFLRDKVINDAMPPVRKKIAGEWLLHRDRVLIDKLVAKHLPELLELIEAERQRIYAAVEGAIVDEPCYDPETGKQVHRGESVTIDTIKHLKESLVFIESNGKNNARAELRAAIKRLREGA